jgi:hypothetical protein
MPIPIMPRAFPCFVRPDNAGLPANAQWPAEMPRLSAISAPFYAQEVSLLIAFLFDSPNTF